MPRRSREDEPGALHHVFNRGIARRTVFETREDVRYFLSRLARVCRAGILEIHTFCILTNHFHLIVGSPVGRLSSAVQQAVNPFVRWFNRRRKRDGSLFRGRFGSRPIHSTTYLSRLIPYVDQNSSEARLVSHSELYPYGSASLFQQAKSPKWHRRDRIERLVCELMARREYSPGLYRECFGRELTPAELEWLELRIRWPRDGPDPLDDLVGAAPERVREWMVRKSKLADGTRPGLPVVAPSVVRAVLDERILRAPDLRFPLRGRSRNIWPILTAGILREECGLSNTATAIALGRAPSTVAAAHRDHRDFLRSEDTYATLAAEVLVDAMALQFAPGRNDGVG